jgi:hypothetical protein
MKKALIAIVAAVMMATASHAQILVAGWDFQTTSTGGTAVAVSPGTSKIYTANFGAGSLYFDGSNGSSNWFVPTSGSTNTELNAFGGSNVNTVASDGTLLSSVTTGTSALAVVGGAATGTAANGKSAVFVFSMTGKADLSISLSAQRSGTGFSTQLWQYSADGGSTWGNIGSLISGTTAGTIQDTFAKSGVLSFASFSALDGVSDARLRVTFTGASNTSGNNRLDNIQLNAVAVPEPSSSALLVLGGVSLVAIRSLCKKNS